MTNSPRIVENLSEDPSRLEKLFTLLYVLQRRKIRDRAHTLFLQRGGADGQDLRDWLQAERELFGSPPRR
jgi:hypothetical protein